MVDMLDPSQLPNVLLQLLHDRIILVRLDPIRVGLVEAAHEGGSGKKPCFEVH